MKSKDADSNGEERKKEKKKRNPYYKPTENDGVKKDGTLDKRTKQYKEMAGKPQ